jgi:hypothetical protein
MTNLEFTALGNFAVSLWPAFNLSADQKAIWFSKMQHTDYDTAHAGLADAYADCKWKNPTLADVLGAIRKRRQSQQGDEIRAGLHPAFIEQVQREEAEEAQILNDWTAQDREDAKAEIIRREPGMKEFSGMSALREFWTHFIVERFHHQRACIPMGDGWNQIPRDIYWGAAP